MIRIKPGWRPFSSSLFIQLMCASQMLGSMMHASKVLAWAAATLKAATPLMAALPLAWPPLIELNEQSDAPKNYTHSPTTTLSSHALNEGSVESQPSWGVSRWRLRTLVGLQSGGSLHPDRYQRQLGYLTLSTGGSILASLDGEFSIRMQGNSEKSDTLASRRTQKNSHYSSDSNTFSPHVEITSGYLTSWSNSIQVRLGWQKIAWGETFGFYIADLVNPRDYSDPWINDIDWMRRATPLAQLKWLGKAMSLELVATPFPRHAFMPSPSRLGGYPMDSLTLLAPKRYDPGISSMEKGGRLSGILPTGTDLSLMALHHWNRNLAYQLEPSANGMQLRPIDHQVMSLGISASHSLERSVLRLDSVLHLRQPWASQIYGQIALQDVWESVIGIDHNFDAGQSLGLQFHRDSWSWSKRQAISLRLATQAEPEGVQWELFSYLGLGKNCDIWIQPRATWSPSARWQVKLQANLFDGRGDLWRPDRGVVSPLAGRASVLLWITAHL